MRTLIIILQTMFTGLGGVLGWYLGGWDGFLYALLAFVIADYVTGLACAIVNHQVSSAVGFKGISRKVLIFILVGLANLLDVYVLKEGGVLRTAVIFFYISNEGISLIENAARLGLPVPQKLQEALASLTRTKHPSEAEVQAPGGAVSYAPKHKHPLATNDSQTFSTHTPAAENEATDDGPSSSAGGAAGCDQSK